MDDDLESPIRVVTISFDPATEHFAFNYVGMSHFEALGLLEAVHTYVQTVVQGIGLAHLESEDER